MICYSKSDEERAAIRSGTRVSRKQTERRTRRKKLILSPYARERDFVKDKGFILSPFACTTCFRQGYGRSDTTRRFYLPDCMGYTATRTRAPCYGKPLNSSHPTFSFSFLRPDKLLSSSYCSNPPTESSVRNGYALRKCRIFVLHLYSDLCTRTPATPLIL